MVKGSTIYCFIGGVSNAEWPKLTLKYIQPTRLEDLLRELGDVMLWEVSGTEYNSHTHTFPWAIRVRLRGSLGGNVVVGRNFGPMQRCSIEISSWLLQLFSNLNKWMKLLFEQKVNWSFGGEQLNLGGHRNSINGNEVAVSTFPCYGDQWVTVDLWEKLLMLQIDPRNVMINLLI